MSGGGEEGGVFVAPSGGWSVCGRLESRCAFVWVEESEMCCSRASNACDRLESFEDEGLAICCGMHALVSHCRDLCVDFANDIFFCDSLIVSRLLLFHCSYPRVEFGQSSVSSQVCLSVFDHLQVPTNTFVYGLSYHQRPIHGLTCCVALSKLSQLNSNICPQMPRGRRAYTSMASLAAPTSSAASKSLMIEI